MPEAQDELEAVYARNALEMFVVGCGERDAQRFCQLVPGLKMEPRGVYQNTVEVKEAGLEPIHP